MGRLKRIAVAALFASVMAPIASPAGAGSLYTVNGVPPSPAVSLYMARNGLSPGAYWLNRAGYWGRAGNPVPRGNIYAQANTAPRPGLSQRGMLYRPGEILNGR
jgi:hypothetical protein